MRSGRGYADAMPGASWSLKCHYCNDRIGLYEPVRVFDADGRAVAATALDLHADPQRARPMRVLHRACADSAGFTNAAPG